MQSSHTKSKNMLLPDQMYGEEDEVNYLTTSAEQEIFAEMLCKIKIVWRKFQAGLVFQFFQLK